MQSEQALRQGSPSLRDIIHEAVEADKAFSKYASMPITSDDDFRLLEDAALRARDDVYAAFEQEGVSREELRALGGVL